jgi:4-hydroxybenzoate polyprenyltransferase
MLSLIKKWASFVRFSHTVFALPFALAAMAVAARENRGWPGWRTFGLVLAAMVCARTCAMAFNRIVDRKSDALNPRTAGRHLPTGQISLVAICFYSLTKRFTDYTHVFLGLALALAPVGAWLAVKGEFGFASPAGMFSSPDSFWAWEQAARVGMQPVVLALAVVLWLVGFDIIYSLQDYEFDKAHGLHSLVVAWGQKNALQAAFLAHMVMCGLLLAFGLLCRFRIAYLVGWMIIVGCLVLEHWIARRRSLDWINLAFFRLNAVVSAVFLIVTVAEVVFQGGFRLR